MDLLILLVVTGAVAWLWNRVDVLERKTEWLEQSLDAAARATPRPGDESQAPGSEAESAPERVTEPHSARVTVPHSDEQPAKAPPPPASPLAVATIKRQVSAPAVTRRAEPGPEAETQPVDRRSWRPSFDFEDIFGRLLPIWAGGIALAIAGFFLVRWSIETGILDQNVRVALGFIFGLVLLAAAELAHRFVDRLADERVRQALAGAGLATLYASFYFAGTHYGLIGGGLAFAGLAAVTALALVLSFRFGLPSAVLGLVGGFAAPALAGASDPNLPLLATYLALVTGGLSYTGRRQNRAWLGLAALAGGLGWGALMLLAGPFDEAAVIAIGGYLVLVGTMLPALMGDSALGRIGRIAACALATLQIAALVDRSGYALLAWGAYVLLATAVGVLGWRHRQLREAGAIAAALSACLIAAWPDPSGPELAMIAAAMATIFVGAPLALIARERAEHIDWGQLALYPPALVAALCLQLWISIPGETHALLALASLALAIPPAIGAWLRWPRPDEHLAPGPMAAFASATVTLVLAGLLATPGWAAPLITAAVAIIPFALLRSRDSKAADALAWSLGLAGIVLLSATAGWGEIARVTEGAGEWNLSRDFLRWLAAALPFALLVLRGNGRPARRAAQLLGVAFAYGALAQAVPSGWLPALVAAGTLALAYRMRWRAAHAGALAISALWASPVLALWAFEGIGALMGEPMLVMSPEEMEWMLRTLPPLLAAWTGSLLLSPRFFAERRKAAWAIAGTFALVLEHMCYKTLFAISGMAEFAAFGMAERTVWQAAFALPALVLLSLPTKADWQRSLGTGFALVALAHFGIFTLVLHNPLWAEQAVGSLPLANLLLPAYALAIALLAALRAELVGMLPKARPALDAAMMALLALLALSQLRHAFSGTFLTAAGMTQQEDLLRSILAIALALAFLAWGAWKKQRSWRIGSLVLMLLAVTKVFLFDAAGLEGLGRIASFLALGLCLIGIGWFYTRQLKGDGMKIATPENEPSA